MTSVDQSTLYYEYLAKAGALYPSLMTQEIDGTKITCVALFDTDNWVAAQTIQEE
jgi:hypothetical protein